MMNDPFAPLLRSHGSIVLDGGLATELERRRADLRDPLWSAKILIERPGLIRAVHAAYADAGAQVAIGASYQASFEGFAARGIEARTAADLMRRSIALAREGAGGGLVAASVGPYGAILADGSEYTGDYGRTPDDLYAFHARRLEVLADPSAGADILAVETIPSIVETEAIVRALDDHPSMPAWVSFTCRDGAHLHDGTKIETAVSVAAAAPTVIAVGVNCTAPAHVSSLVRRIRSVAPARMSVIAYPNRGAAYDPTAKTWGGAAPARFGDAVRGWMAAGALAVGGCCGTGPPDIAAISAALGHRAASGPA